MRHWNRLDTRCCLPMFVPFWDSEQHCDTLKARTVVKYKTNTFGRIWPCRTQDFIAWIWWTLVTYFIQTYLFRCGSQVEMAWDCHFRCQQVAQETRGLVGVSTSLIIYQTGQGMCHEMFISAKQTKGTLLLLRNGARSANLRTRVVLATIGYRTSLLIWHRWNTWRGSVVRLLKESGRFRGLVLKCLAWDSSVALTGIFWFREFRG